MFARLSSSFYILFDQTWSDIIHTGSGKKIHLYETRAKGKRTAAGIPTWSPTVVLISRSTAYVWQSGRDAQFSAAYGRT